MGNTHESSTSLGWTGSRSLNGVSDYGSTSHTSSTSPSVPIASSAIVHGEARCVRESGKVISDIPCYPGTESKPQPHKSAHQSTKLEATRSIASSKQHHQPTKSSNLQGPRNQTVVNSVLSFQPQQSSEKVNATIRNTGGEGINTVFRHLELQALQDLLIRNNTTNLDTFGHEKLQDPKTVSSTGPANSTSLSASSSIPLGVTETRATKPFMFPCKARGQPVEHTFQVRPTRQALTTHINYERGLLR